MSQRSNAPVRVVATPDRLERQRAEARAKWEAWQHERELAERLEEHRRLAFGEAVQ